MEKVELYDGYDGHLYLKYGKKAWKNLEEPGSTFLEMAEPIFESSADPSQMVIEDCDVRDIGGVLKHPDTKLVATYPGQVVGHPSAAASLFLAGYVSS